MLKKEYCSIFCLFVVVCLSLVFLITSTVIFVLSGKNLEEGISWNKSNVTNGISTLLPFDPYKCPKNEYFYSQPFLIFLTIESHFNADMTLSLYNTNMSQEDNKLGSCHALGNSSCTLLVPSLANTFAFVLAKGKDPVYTVEWGCYYLNLPFLVSTISLFISGLCLIPSCCFLIGIPIRKFVYCGVKDIRSPGNTPYGSIR